MEEETTSSSERPGGKAAWKTLEEDGSEDIWKVRY